MTSTRPLHLRKGWVPALSAALVVVVGSGCEPVATDPQSTAKNSLIAARYWQPLPVNIRVYPSTRFIKESGRAVLEARFELYDDMGDPVKSAGTFRIELLSVDEALGNAPRRLLYTWNAEVLTLDQQREHYDPITRGYLFRLGVDDLRIARQVTLLKVTFSPVDRPRLDAEAVIKSDW